MSLIVQPSLFGSTGSLGITELGAAVERKPLADGAWVDVRPGFVTAADELFDALAAGLRDALTERGLDIRLLREPGGVAASERIRDLVIDPDLHLTSRTEALLYAASRAQLVEEAIEPLLSTGTWLLLDRFIDSSLAYQGGGRQLGIDAVRAINEFAIRTVRPDRTLLLMIDPQRGRSRSRSRAGAPDRLEREQDDFFERTIAAYLELCSQEPDRIRKIDASQSPDQVLATALKALADLLPASAAA